MSCSCFGRSVVHRRRSTAQASGGIDEQLLGRVNHFSYNQLRSATDDFHSSNKIGRGGFGTVYKGVLKDGTEVAVKTLAAQSKQGVREFLTEINTISNVKHPNLVQLIGCCVQGTNRTLIYEYVENKSLDKVLLDQRSTNFKLDWSKRSVICIGIARGLAFIHEELVPHIVHRDIKSSNILLDKDFNPKIGDFGLAKLFPDNITHISTRIAGTTGRSSSKANWGGMEKFLLEWAWQLYEEGKLIDLVDPELGEFPKEEVLRYMKVAFFCTQAAANRRPLMSQVIEMLARNIRLNEKVLTAPGFFQDGVASSSKKSIQSSAESTSYQMSSVPVTITQVTPRKKVKSPS
ncbi:hypothetical protein CRYUN_Cryun37aG0110600 [Craigia yunnanensis]